MDPFYYNQNYTGTTVPNSRVYVNPNFNKNGNGATNSSVMYLNPNFSKTHHNIRNETITPRIHINPNFIKQTQNHHLPSNTNTMPIAPIIPVATHSEIIHKPENKNESNTPLSNSRYSLVRRKENNTVNTSNPQTKTVTNTVKVNKYKTISIKTAQKNIADKIHINKITETRVTVNQSIIKSKSKYRVSHKPIVNNVPSSRFKYVKRNSASTLNVSITKCNVIRRSSSVNKSILKSTSKKVKGALKKNNIPCPQYKKYGKCLRMARGTCEFLHDKKHVSICRKFMKGICHDEHCLLSHDLTDKKMPTCYFYLQGICTKEGCPYLHVKLNEKTKICQDFLKGYCDRGDKCLNRHVNITESTLKETSARRRNSQSRNKINKRVGTERAKVKRTNTENRKTIEKTELPKHKNDEDRYFKDLASDAKPDEQYNLIKPSRCKLGALPSFIQL